MRVRAGPSLTELGFSCFENIIYLHFVTFLLGNPRTLGSEKADCENCHCEKVVSKMAFKNRPNSRPPEPNQSFHCDLPRELELKSGRLTPLELFLAGIEGWEAGIRRFVEDEHI